MPPVLLPHKTNLQYQTYDITDLLTENNTLTAVVGGGWAVGSFVFTRQNVFPPTGRLFCWKSKSPTPTAAPSS